uniref:Cytochrome b5 heme-binding domain-containing protein n=1 Tax=Strombidium rassoulzadegani TaxID=1082188 RepID=A0A7S3CKK9_9SPIT|mmetsp:Transcript_1424/g.2498  ORF Transcript_1424/g.2498 Transcript_1424/m.2498 type:complete len:110 (+) Transcript_1424:301-630(+)
MDEALNKILKKMDDNNKARAEQAAKNPQSQKKTITRAEVMKHNKPNDFWVILKTKVYNISNFPSEHPGGQSVLTRFMGTGQDAWPDFEEAEHSKRALNRLKQFYIGELE